MIAEQREPFEEMAAFFDLHAGGYDDHMRSTITSFEDFYRSVAEPIAATQDPIRILDLGIGTGLEVEFILQRAPNARITGIDLSTEMLTLLRAKYEDWDGQIDLVQDSYLTRPLGVQGYDYVVAVMTLHHLLPDGRRALYTKIRHALKPGALFIEGEYVVSSEDEQTFLQEHATQAPSGGSTPDGMYHIDLPFSLKTHTRLLTEAGFSAVDVIWHQSLAAIIVSRA